MKLKQLAFQHRPSSDSLHTLVFSPVLVKKTAVPLGTHTGPHSQHMPALVHKKGQALSHFSFLLALHNPTNPKCLRIGQFYEEKQFPLLTSGLSFENKNILPHHAPRGISEIQIRNEPLSSLPASQFCMLMGREQNLLPVRQLLRLELGGATVRGL